MADIEQEARTLGWVPQEEFKGDPERWVDADAFVERGKTVMPILRENNKRLEGELSKLKGETERLKTLFQASQEAIQGLQEVHTSVAKAAAEKARKDLLAELKIAKTEGDIDREIELTDELSRVTAAQKDAERKPVHQVQQPADAIHPDFKGWMADNPWFGTDQRKTMRAMGIAQELRSDAENDTLVGRKFYDRIMEIMEERTTGRNLPSKVSSARSSTPSGNSIRTYSDLSPEEKAACDHQAKKCVGEGRAFSDMASWRKYYIEMISGESK